MPSSANLIRLTGMNSGLDTESIITALVSTKQTKVDDDVTGLVGVAIPTEKATSPYTVVEGQFDFYFDVYNQNNGAYAVKVIKIVD